MLQSRYQDSLIRKEEVGFGAIFFVIFVFQSRYQDSLRELHKMIDPVI
jgi:hypothetical protein